MMAPTPRVSVCLPVYNGARHLQATLDSVLAQEFGDFELLVQDNASTDETPDIVQAVGDPRLRYRRTDWTLEVGDNWNSLLAIAQAPYVKLVCADDLLYPSCLAEQVAVLDHHEGVVLVAARRDIVDDGGAVVIRDRGLAGMRGEVAGATAIGRVARHGTNPLGEPAAVLLRRRALLAAGGFRTAISYMTDADLWCRVLRHGSLYALPRTLCAFRLTPGSWSERLASEQARQSRAFVGLLRRDFPDAVTRTDELVGMARASALSVGRRAVYTSLRLRGRSPRVTQGEHVG